MLLPSEARGWDGLGLDFQAVVRCLVWVLALWVEQHVVLLTAESLLRFPGSL